METSLSLLKVYYVCFIVDAYLDTLFGGIELEGLIFFGGGAGNFFLLESWGLFVGVWGGGEVVIDKSFGWL